MTCPRNWCLRLLSAAARRAIIRVGESERTYLAYVPAGLMPHSPLFLVLHGGLMDGEMIRRGTGYEFDVLADRHGFAVVYPDGYKATGTTAGERTPSGDSTNRCVSRINNGDAA